MTELKDRLDRLARQATEGVELPPLDLMVRARRRHRTRVGLGVAGAAVLAAVGTVVGFVTTLSRHTTVVNMGTSPRGSGYSCGADVPGMVYIYEQPGSGGASQCGLAPNVVSITSSSTAALPHAAPAELNSIEVTTGWTQVGSLRTEIVRALGYDISAGGPRADQVVHTLTHSPLSVVLN